MTPEYPTRVIIGGAPSTGSSLLRRILHRHPLIYCGEESHLFSKLELYQDWQAAKSKLFKRSFAGLRSAGWHNFTGVNLDQLDWSHDELLQITKDANSFSSFADQLYSKVLKEKQASSWIEKTPSNAYCFIEFLNLFEGKVIHIVRNPLDNIASMISRGDGVYKAVCHYLLSNAHALRSRANSKQITIHYESLVADPKATMSKVCDFLQLDYSDKILQPTQQEKQIVSKMKGWTYDETEEVRSRMVSKFDALSEVDKQALISAIYQIRIKASFVEKDNLPVQTIMDIADQLGFSLPDDPAKKISFHSAKAADIAFRTHRWYPYHMFNYPIEF